MRVGLGRPRRPLRASSVSPVRRYSARRIVLISCYVGGFRQVDESPVCGTRVVGEFVARVDGRAREQSLSRDAHATLYQSLSSLPHNHADLRPQGHPLGPVHDTTGSCERTRKNSCWLSKAGASRQPARGASRQPARHCWLSTRASFRQPTTIFSSLHGQKRVVGCRKVKERAGRPEEGSIVSIPDASGGRVGRIL